MHSLMESLSIIVYLVITRRTYVALFLYKTSNTVHVQVREERLQMAFVSCERETTLKLMKKQIIHGD